MKQRAMKKSARTIGQPMVGSLLAPLAVLLVLRHDKGSVVVQRAL